METLFGKRWLRWTLRVFIAAVFVLSAVSKLMPAAIDQFELYVFSFGFFSLDCSYILARLCIGAELVLAMLILVGWYPRLTRLLTVGMLLLFSLFLCYAALVGRDDSCQCFGQLSPMPPMLSLLKNAVLIVLALLYFRAVSPKDGGRKGLRLGVTLLMGVLLMATPFAVSVPDNWGFGPEHYRIDAETLGQATAEGRPLNIMGVGEGHKLVAFVTPRCPYCQLARQRLDAIAERNHIDKGQLVYVEAGMIPDTLFLAITHGARPLILLMDGQQVTATYHSRNIDEKEITDFLIY